MADEEQFDKYATQFNRSLTIYRLGGDPPYWHGRMIGNKDSSTRYLISLPGANPQKPETEYRPLVDSGNFGATTFDIIEGPDYTPDTSDSAAGLLDPQIVEYKAKFEGKINDRPVSGDVMVTHKIRRTYIAYETTIEFV